VKEGIIEVACDGTEALKSISREFRTSKGGSNSFSMVAPTRKYLSQSNLKWTFRHVKGHQDKPREEFDICERLNDDCNTEAGIVREWREPQTRPQHSLSFPAESLAIWKGTSKVATNLQKELYKYIHKSAAK
jgi:hypothetical protein